MRIWRGRPEVDEEESPTYRQIQTGMPAWRRCWQTLRLALRMYAIMYMRRWIMKVMSMSESRANYAATLDSVINDQEEVVITRPGGEDVVMIPLREYESMRETLYLMSSPVNRQRISRSIEQLNRGSGQVHELMDPDGNGE
jgi:antitoxin YefM